MEFIMQADVIAIADSCPTCGSSVSQAKLAEIRVRMDGDQRRLTAMLRAGLAGEHQEAL